MKCVNCGAELAEDARFCSACGANQTDLKVEKNTELNSVRICPFCGAENDADAKFCEKCGKDMDAAEHKTEPGVTNHVVYCPFCGAENEPGDVFCASCGKKISAIEEGENLSDKSAASSVGRKRSKKGLVIVIAVVAAACVTGAFLGLKGGITLPTKKEPQIMVYEQDDEIYMVDLGNSRKESVELPGNEIGESDDKQLKKITPDGLYLCYLASQSESDYTYAMYLKKINSKDEAEKIASGVESFDMLDDGTVIYQKEQALYKTNYKGDKEKIGSNVGTWSVTDNQKYVIWTGEYDLNIDGYDGLYYSDIALKNGKQKLASSLDSSIKATADGNKVYFLDEGDLYVIKDLRNKEKIASGANLSRYMDDEGSVYYLKANDELLLADLVEDDLVTEDQESVYPQEKDYQREVAVNSRWAGTYTYVETDYDAYNEALEQYNEAYRRNQIRDILNDPEISGSLLKKYCKYSDKGEITLATDVFYQDGWDKGTKGIGYLTYSEGTQIRMSEIYEELCATGQEENVSESVIKGIMLKMLEKDGIYKYCDDNGPISLSENIRYMFCDEAGKTGYGVLTETYDSYQADLYTFPLTGEKAGLCSLYEEDILLGNDDGDDFIYIIKEINGNLYYFKGQDTYSCELYKDKNMIATDVVSILMLKNDVIYYFSDANEREQSFSFWKVEEGKSTKIADDIASFHIFNSNSIALLTDYSSKREKGTLVYYNGKNLDTIADDIQMFPIS